MKKRLLQFFGEEQSYWTANLSMVAFNLALVVFGFAPLLIDGNNYTIRVVEFAVGFFSILAVMGIIMHMLNSRRWLPRWSYLITCFSSALTGLMYLWSDPSEFSLAGQFAVFFLLTTGGLVALSMHVEYGNDKQLVRAKSQR